MKSILKFLAILSMVWFALTVQGATGGSVALKIGTQGQINSGTPANVLVTAGTLNGWTGGGGGGGISLTTATNVADAEIARLAPKLTNSNVLTGPNTFNGGATVRATLSVTGSVPTISIVASNAPANQRKWKISIDNSGTLQFACLNDAEDSLSQPLTITHNYSGGTVMSINGGLLIPQGAAAGYLLGSDASGNASWGGNALIPGALNVTGNATLLGEIFPGGGYFSNSGFTNYGPVVVGGRFQFPTAQLAPASNLTNHTADFNFTERAYLLTNHAHFSAIANGGNPTNAVYLTVRLDNFSGSTKTVSLASGIKRSGTNFVNVAAGQAVLVSLANNGPDLTNTLGSITLFDSP